MQDPLCFLSLLHGNCCIAWDMIFLLGIDVCRRLGLHLHLSPDDRCYWCSYEISSRSWLANQQIFVSPHARRSLSAAHSHPLFKNWVLTSMIGCTIQVRRRTMRMSFLKDLKGTTRRIGRHCHFFLARRTRANWYKRQDRCYRCTARWTLWPRLSVAWRRPVRDWRGVKSYHVRWSWWAHDLPSTSCWLNLVLVNGEDRRSFASWSLFGEIRRGDFAKDWNFRRRTYSYQESG